MHIAATASVVDVDERARIKQIEDEEWHHRELVGGMLEKLEAHPNKQREIRSLLLGRVLGFLCHLMGWFAPMYGAGRLESRNIREYETAARYERDCGREEFVDCLLTMGRWSGNDTLPLAWVASPFRTRLPSVLPRPEIAIDIIRAEAEEALRVRQLAGLWI